MQAVRRCGRIEGEVPKVGFVPRKNDIHGFVILDCRRERATVSVVAGNQVHHQIEVVRNSRNLLSHQRDHRK